MYEVYITKVVDGVGEYTDTYMRRELGKIFDEAGVHVFTMKKTDMAWGVNKREWHEAFEVVYVIPETEAEKTSVIVYLINKAFSGAKAVYSIREVGSTVKPFYMGSHTIKGDSKTLDVAEVVDVNIDGIGNATIRQIVNDEDIELTFDEKKPK